MDEETLGVGPHVTKVVPSKRLKAAHRNASTSLSLKEWARRKSLNGDNRIRPWATEWLGNK